MKRLIIAVMAVVFAMGMPSFVLAMSHGEHGSDDKGMQKGHDMGMDHGKEMSHDMHKDHDMGGGDDFIEVGKDTRDGVVATVKVKTYDEETMATMNKMGMEATHHVMVFFTDEKSGDAIVAGKAAIKVRGSGDDKPKLDMLTMMGDGFGGDVNVKGMGMYTFEIGTKLEDGKKRQFEVGFHNM